MPKSWAGLPGAGRMKTRPVFRYCQIDENATLRVAGLTLVFGYVTSSFCDRSQSTKYNVFSR